MPETWRLLVALAAGILIGLVLGGGLYSIATTGAGGVAWRVNKLTGSVTVCMTSNTCSDR